MESREEEVKTSETIKNLKSILHEKEGISENLQELFFTGEQLKDDQKLVDYGIQTNSTLHLVLQNLDSIKFYVHIPSYQKTFELEAKNSDTIQNIKSLVLAKEGIQSDRYNLFYSGMLLEDNKTLASLKIQGGSLLYLIFNSSDVLSVFVKMSTGEMVKPEVKVLYTIGDVKAIVGSMVGFSVSDQSLIYAGKQLEDGKTLASYNIRENTMLEMSPSAFQIFVKDWNGKTVILDVHPLDTVEGVKIKIFNKLRMPVKVQGLVFAGKRLENDRDLVSYNIQKHSTLHMVFWPTTWVKKMKVSDIEGRFFGLRSSTTIRGLKALIEKMLKKPVKEVSINGLALQDQSSLADYAIEQNTELTIAMEVF